MLGSELGNVIKDQAGAKYFKIVEDIRLNSKKYRQTNNNKYLDSIFKTLQSLEPNEIYIITKAFTIFFYLSNIAEQVFREHTLKNSNISINKKTNNELIFMPVFTAHPTESSRQSTLKKIYKIAEIIENNKNGYFAEDFLDIDANNFVKNLINDDDYFNMVMIDCIQKSEKYNWNTTADSLFKTYQDVKLS